MTIRKAILKHAAAMDIDQPQADELCAILEWVAANYREILRSKLDRFPERPSDLLADGKKLCQLAGHAEAITRLLAEIGEPGRRLLFMRFGSEKNATWPRWMGGDPAEFDRHCEAWLEPFRNLAEDGKLQTVPVGGGSRRILSIMSQDQIRQHEAVRVTRAIIWAWTEIAGTIPAAKSGPFADITRATLDAVEPELGRRAGAFIEQATTA